LIATGPPRTKKPGTALLPLRVKVAPLIVVVLLLALKSAFALTGYKMGSVSAGMGAVL
jgi:hypothetical protein